MNFKGHAVLITICIKHVKQVLSKKQLIVGPTSDSKFQLLLGQSDTKSHLEQTANKVCWPIWKEKWKEY